MNPNNTSKDQEKACGEVLEKPDNTGNKEEESTPLEGHTPKHDNSSKSESLSEESDSIRYNDFKLGELKITNFCLDCNKEVLKPFLRCIHCNDKKLGKNYTEMVEELDNFKKFRSELRKKRFEEDANLRLICLFRNRFGMVMNKYTKTGKIMSSKKYGINYSAIIEHLKPFPEDLSKYHIHHIIPLFTFNFINPDGSTNLEEVKKAFAPKNHKFLLIEEHRNVNHWEIGKNLKYQDDFGPNSANFSPSTDKKSPKTDNILAKELQIEDRESYQINNFIR